MVKQSITKKKPSKPSRREVVQFAQYFVSGGAFFWTGYAVFFVCDQLLGLNLWWAKLIANVSGWTVNYLLQRYWVFNHPNLRKNQTQVTARYIFITLVNFLLDYGIIWSLKSLGLTPYLGQFLSAGFFTVWNYVWYRFWVFPEKSGKNSEKRKK